MSTVTINNSPFHSQASITRVYGYISGSYSCGYHTGVDLVSSNRAIYPPFDGTVTYLNTSGSGSLGVQVQVIDGAGRYWRFCHMQLGSNTHLSVGQQVTTGTQIGIMGGTGNVTGDHLHLECQSQSSWQCGTFYNPCEILGIPNEVGTVVNYDGTTPPVPPTINWIYKNSYLTVSEMINNANLVINYYRSQGVNDTAISAILGNMQAESTIEPILTERGGGGGYGLVQWTPKSSLINHASILGYSDYTNGDVQCAVVLNEIRGTPASVNEWYTTQAFISRYYNSGATGDMIGISGADFLANSMGWSADKLAVLFMAGYERPSYSPSINHVEDRKANAIYWFNYMGGYIPPEPPTPQPVDKEKSKNFPWVLYSNKFRGKRGKKL